MTYENFLQSKIITSEQHGFEVNPEDLNPALFPHQRDIAAWAIRGGCRAVFAAFGLGKTLIQIQILKIITVKAGGDGLIICPLGVKQEFVRDAKKFFKIDIAYIRTNAEYYEKAAKNGGRHSIYITNYERIRDGQLDPNLFNVVSLDEASVLRSFGSKTYQTFLTLFADVKYKYVCTATPAPNRFKELIHYAGFLGVMDTGQALTRFFKRNSQVAGELTLHPHKEREFWLWMSTWATFLSKPSDLGYSDEGYDLPPLKIITHRLPIDHTDAGVDRNTRNLKIFKDGSRSLPDAARFARETMPARIQKALEIVSTDPDDHWLIWHYLEDERRMIENMLPDAVSVYGTQDLDEREGVIAAFTDGQINILSTKPELAGSGCNFQRFCHKCIFVNVSEKFNDIIQAIHRLQRFLQTEEVEVHFIYSAASDKTYESMMKKWTQHNELTENMTQIVKKYGLTGNVQAEMQQRGMGVERLEIKGNGFTCVHNDNVPEMAAMATNSVDMFLSSWPFSDQYEYSPNYSDFGHNDGDDEFFAQMNYLTPETLRVLKPGRRYCLHVKDRIVFGYQKPYGHSEPVGRYSVNPFSDKCVAHMVKHGFVYDGRITIDTDVVRENNQTNRLTRGEMRKDGTKMGVGMPEYILLFYKPQSDTSKGYADDQVLSDMDNDEWQLVASSIWRSDGGYRFLTPEKIKSLPLSSLKALWKKHCKETYYSYEEHVAVNRALVENGTLPGSFMLLPPYCHNTEWIWEDITRMRTLNCDQSKGRKENHTCPLQFDVVERLIKRYTNPGELVVDPFGGLMTVPYCAMKLGRRGLGIELNPDYFTDGVAHCRRMEYKLSVPTLWDLAEMDEMEVMEEAA